DDAAYQDVARSSRRRNRRTGQQTSEYAQSGRRSRYSTRVSDQSLAQQSVHATVRAGVEETRAREALESVHRELCRRPRHLLSSWSGASPDRDAGDDVEAETDGEREQDAGLLSAGREV